MVVLNFILGDPDDTHWTKLIPVGIIVLLWAVGAVTTAARRASAGKAAGPPPAPPRPPVPPPPSPVFAVPRYAAPRVPVARVPGVPPPVPKPPPALQRRRVVAPPLPPPLPPPLLATLRVSPLDGTDFPEASGPKAGPTPAVGPRVRLTPTALQSAIVFTEVFDPPAALRDETRR